MSADPPLPDPAADARPPNDLPARLQAAGVTDDASLAQLTPKLAGFKALPIAAQEEQNQPPVLHALRAFIQVPDEGAARTLFDQQRALLQPYEAQSMLDQFSRDDPATHQHVAERDALLRQLRGTASIPATTPPALPNSTVEPAPTFDNQQMQVDGDLYQAQTQYNRSAHAEPGGVATVVNNLFVQNLARQWAPPSRGLDRDAVARLEELAQIQQALATHGQAALSRRRQSCAIGLVMPPTSLGGGIISSRAFVWWSNVPSTSRSWRAQTQPDHRNFGKCRARYTRRISHDRITKHEFGQTRHRPLAVRHQLGRQ